MAGFFIALLSGALMSVQGVFNTQVTKTTGMYVSNGWVQFSAFLVCLAVWCGFKCKSESGKLIMIFWCLFAFITTGFEHSIANMTLLTISLLAPMEAAVTIGGYAYNLIVVTLGNMVGGILFVAIPYYLISKKKETV